MTRVEKIQEFALPKQENVKRIVYIGLSVLALSVSMYVYLVGKIVFDVVGRRTAEASIKASQSEISGLAVDYYKQVKSIDISQAGSVGLALSHDTLYASRSDTSSATLGMAAN